MDAIIGKDKTMTRVNKTNKRSRNRRPRRRFANYLVFGFSSTVCLGLFALCYGLVLIILWPLLQASTPEDMPDETARDYIHNMHVPPSLKEIAHVPGEEKIKKVTGNLRKKLELFRRGKGATDADLLDKATAQYEALKKQRAENEQVQNDGDKPAPTVAGGGHGRTGFMILGMHRSGTSMLSGLLHKSAGYNVGGPLIGSHFDNEMGFFERVDIVLQNDIFMNKQNVWWNSNVAKYDWKKAIEHKETKAIKFKEGAKGLQFLNNPDNTPWMQKDPRMCITLKTWLAIMNNEPAIVFTYRHPLEVAMSIHKRDDDIGVDTGLRLWIVYNMRAIQNSKGLCVVRSSNDAILADPLTEVQRISDELTNKCGVPAPPNRIKQEEIDKFIDPKLQHNKSKKDTGKAVLETHNDGKCVVRVLESKAKEGTTAYKREQQLYRQAMKVYCDLQSGIAYEENYEWPVLK